MKNSPYLDRPLRSEREVKMAHAKRWPRSCIMCDGNPCQHVKRPATTDGGVRQTIIVVGCPKKGRDHV